MISVREQTVVVLARATAFTVVCQACAELEPGAEYALVTAQGSLRLEQDVGWTDVPPRPPHPRDPRRRRRAGRGHVAALVAAP